MVSIEIDVDCARDRDVAKCREMGWSVGDLLVGTEGGEGWSETAVIELRYVGDHCIVAKQVASNGADVSCREGPWSVTCREWRKITRAELDRYVGASGQHEGER